MLAEPEALYPQFATHNAHTLCSVRAIAAELGNENYEFQRLHGMGEPLSIWQRQTPSPCVRCASMRRSAVMKTCCPIWVRRLLENGANTSFCPFLPRP